MPRAARSIAGEVIFTHFQYADQMNFLIIFFPAIVAPQLFWETPTARLLPRLLAGRQ